MFPIVLVIHSSFLSRDSIHVLLVRAAFNRNRSKNSVKNAIIISEILFLAHLIEKSKISSVLIEESYDLFHNGSTVCLECIVTSSSLISHQLIGVRIDFTHMTKIIISDMYAINNTGLNISQTIVPMDMLFNPSILDVSMIFIDPKIQINIMNGENIKAIRKKNILKKLIIINHNIAIEYITIIIRLSQNSINRFRLLVVKLFISE